MKKNLIVLLASVVAVVSLLFLPFMTFFGESLNLVTLLMELGDIQATLGIMCLMVLVGGVLAIIGAAVKGKKLAFVASIVETVGAVGTIGYFSGEKAIDFMGIGVWITLLCAVAALVFAILDMRAKN